MTREERRIYDRDWKRQKRDNQTLEEAAAGTARYRNWWNANADRLNAKRHGVRGEYTKARYAALHRKTDMQLAAEEDGRRAHWRQKRANRVFTADQLEAARLWRQSQKERFAAKNRELRKTDPVFTLTGRLRNSLRDALRKAHTKKTVSVFKLIGIPIQEFVKYIEAQFLPGMSWDRLAEIHIDHKRPCASFDLTDPEQVAACFHYTNLQPLWAVDNLRKRSRWNGSSHNHHRALPTLNPSTPLEPKHKGESPE